MGAIYAKGITIVSLFLGSGTSSARPEVLPQLQLSQESFGPGKVSEGDMIAAQLCWLYIRC
jgi:hypothetical protein